MTTTTPTDTATNADGAAVDGQERSDGPVWGRTPLEELMAERGLEVAGLAAAARVDPATLRRWVTGGVIPRRVPARRLADTLGVPVGRLWPQLATPTRLADELTRRGLTVRDFASALGVHENSAYRWSTGESDPRPAMAQRIARALNVPVQQLFSRRTDLATEPSPDHNTNRNGDGNGHHDRDGDGPGGGPSRLAALLYRRGLTATELARRLGVDPSTVYGWTQGNAPAAAQAERAAAALGVHPGELFDQVRLTQVNGRTAPVQITLVPGAPTITQVLQTQPTGDPGWRRQAACADPQHDPEAWWPAPTEAGAEARKVCGGCPVLGDCRQAFLGDRRARQYGGEGIWAGLPGHALAALARTCSHGYHTTHLTNPTRQPADQHAGQLWPALGREGIAR